MKKYVCDVCGWEYDEELGYPEGGIAPGPVGRTSPKISSAPCAWSIRTSFLKNEHLKRCG